MVVCLPLTTQVYAGFSRWRVTLAARDCLLKPCQVVTDQPRTLDRARFGEGPLTANSGHRCFAGGGPQSSGQRTLAGVMSNV